MGRSPGGGESVLDENILLPSIPKSAPDEKNPWHACSLPLYKIPLQTTTEDIRKRIQYTQYTQDNQH